MCILKQILYFGGICMNFEENFICWSFHYFAPWSNLKLTIIKSSGIVILFSAYNMQKHHYLMLIIADFEKEDPN